MSMLVLSSMLMALHKSSVRAKTSMPAHPVTVLLGRDANITNVGNVLSSRMAMPMTMVAPATAATGFGFRFGGARALELWPARGHGSDQGCEEASGHERDGSDKTHPAAALSWGGPGGGAIVEAR